MILSVYCPPNDELRDKKLDIFMSIYKKYGDQFVYCIFESDLSEDLFPHCKHSYPCFTLFNYFKQEKDFGAFNDYYKSLVYPYEKYFLNPKSPYIPNKEEVEENLGKFLNKKLRKDYLNNFEGNI